MVEVGSRGRSEPAVRVAQFARPGPWNDCANLPAVAGAACEQTRIGLVLADAEFDSERNHTYIWGAAGSTERHPGQAWHEHLAHARSPRRGAAALPGQAARSC